MPAVHTDWKVHFLMLPDWPFFPTQASTPLAFQHKQAHPRIASRASKHTHAFQHKRAHTEQRLLCCRHPVRPQPRVQACCVLPMCGSAQALRLHAAAPSTHACVHGCFVTSSTCNPQAAADAVPAAG
eukprot:scaffold60682_cov17-Tisochrysis_lutea.AAC.1